MRRCGIRLFLKELAEISWWDQSNGVVVFEVDVEDCVGVDESQRCMDLDTNQHQQGAHRVLNIFRMRRMVVYLCVIRNTNT